MEQQIKNRILKLLSLLSEEHKDKDVDGNDLGTTTKSIKTTVLIPILVKAIQEQQALITNLTNRLTALENK
jgi:hypothetical protein